MNVILGTGPVALAVMNELVHRGESVRMVNRSGSANVPQTTSSKVQVVKADLFDVEEARRAMRGAEVVFHCAQPPYHRWAQLFGRLQDTIVEAAAAEGAKLVMADNLYMYGDVNGRIHEGLPYTATTRKGKVRAELANKLLHAHHAGRLRATIARASDFFGPHVKQSTLGDSVFTALMKGKPCWLLGDADMPHTFTYIKDFARALVTLSVHEDAFGCAWHVPNAPTGTTRQFIDAVYQIAGHRPNFRTVNRMALRFMGTFAPQLRELGEMMYQFEKPFIVDSSQYVQRFGDTFTPMEQAIEETVDWYRQIGK